MPYVPVPRAFTNVGSIQLNNLATAKDVATLQNKVNRDAQKMYQQATVGGLTLRNGVQDMREAIVGIWADLYQNNMNVSVKDLFTKNNRLRGLGLLFVLISLSVILFVTFG
jgi:UDP-N-acetyl-D-mannosaminuronate dehydrogenase